MEAGKEKPSAQTRRGPTGTVAGALAALKTHRRDTLLEAVAERKLAAEKIAALARTDALTH